MYLFQKKCSVKTFWFNWISTWVCHLYLPCIFLSGVCTGEVSEVDEGNGGVAKDVPLSPDHSLQPLIILVLSSITAPLQCLICLGLVQVIQADAGGQGQHGLVWPGGDEDQQEEQAAGVGRRKQLCWRRGDLGSDGSIWSPIVSLICWNKMSI